MSREEAGLTDMTVLKMHEFCTYGHSTETVNWDLIFYS